MTANSYENHSEHCYECGDSSPSKIVHFYISQKKEISTDTNNFFIFCILGALNASNTFCSVCSLYVLIHGIYESSSYQSVTSSRLRIPSADAFVENIEKISSTFTGGTQQAPSEFLVFLLDHLIESLSSNEKSITSIQHIFDINIRRKTRCHICSNQSYMTN